MPIGVLPQGAGAFCPKDIDFLFEHVHKFSLVRVKLNWQKIKENSIM